MKRYGIAIWTSFEKKRSKFKKYEIYRKAWPYLTLFIGTTLRLKCRIVHISSIIDIVLTSKYCTDHSSGGRSEPEGQWFQCLARPGRGAQVSGSFHSIPILCFMEISVADPGCLSRIRIFSIPDPNCLHPGSRIRIKELKYFNPQKTKKIVSKL